MKSILYQRELSKKENSLLLKSIEFKSKLPYMKNAKMFLSIIKEWTIIRCFVVCFNIYRM